MAIVLLTMKSFGEVFNQMRKLKLCLCLFVSVIIIISINVGMWFYRRNILKTSDSLSLAYTPSASSYWKQNYFYVHDNVLYFVDDNHIIKYVKNNVIYTFAEIPVAYDRFIIIDDKLAIIQWKDALHLLNASNDELVELWQGDCVGCYEGQVYFTKDNVLYSAKVNGSEPEIVVSFDELLSSDYTGITYRIGGNIYQFLLEQPNEFKLLNIGEIPWPEISGSIIFNPYLYTSNYALQLGPETLDMYVYETKEMKRIFELDENDVNMVSMAVVAHENEVYVSRQYMDGKLWPLKNKQINGTYKYDIQENTWSKITNKTYSVLVQFDEQHLYGLNDPFRLFPSVTRINID